MFFLFTKRQNYFKLLIAVVIDHLTEIGGNSQAEI
jgi:hypothetical protein